MQCNKGKELNIEQDNIYNHKRKTTCTTMPVVTNCQTIFFKKNHFVMTEGKTWGKGGGACHVIYLFIYIYRVVSNT